MTRHSIPHRPHQSPSMNEIKSPIRDRDGYRLFNAVRILASFSTFRKAGRGVTSGCSLYLGFHQPYRRRLLNIARADVHGVNLTSAGLRDLADDLIAAANVIDAGLTGTVHPEH